MPVNGFSCLFHILYFQEAANFSWLNATSPAWSYSIYKHSFIYTLYSHFTDGVFLAVTVKTLQKQLLLKDTRKISAPRVPTGFNTPSSSSRPEDTRWGGLPHKSQSVSYRQNPPKEEAAGGRALGYFSLL